MEHEIMLTGIGGQGVQLAAQILARAGLLEGRQVMSLGTYGGTMRGGSTVSTVVLADAAIDAPPIVSKVASALAMHHAHWPAVEKKLRPDALVVINSSVFEGELDAVARARGAHWRVCPLPASAIARELGHPLTAAMVLIAAWSRISGLLRLESLVAVMRDSLPSYRAQHAAANEAALHAGWSAVAATPPLAAEEHG